MRSVVGAISGAVVVVLVLACDDPAKKPPPAPTRMASLGAKTGKDYYAMRCVGCHGKEGKGDGPAAASLSPKPRTFTDKEWQRSVTDEHIKKIVVKGGLAVGKSSMMPGNLDLASDDVILDGLVAEVRAFGK